MLTQFHLLVFMIVTVVIMSYILGLIIVKVVDGRLRDITIKLPPYTGQKESGQEGGGVAERGIGRLPPARGDFDSDKYRSESREVDRPAMDEQVKTWKPDLTSSTGKPLKCPDHPDHPDEVDVEEEKEADGVGEEFTYYLPLEQMTGKQIEKFRRLNRFENMTLKDYRNWLKIQDIEDIAPYHRPAWRKVYRGEPLDRSEHPKWLPSPAEGDGVLESETPWVKADLSDSMTVKGAKGVRGNWKEERGAGVLDLVRPESSLLPQHLSSEEFGNS